MKKLCCFCVALFTCLCASSQVVTIPDANFKTKLLEASPSNEIAKNLNGDFFKIDVNDDLEIQVTEAIQVSYLNVQRDFSIPNSTFISSLEGILSFSNLQDLNCSNNQLTSLNINGMTSILNLDCSGNQLTTMNLTGLTNLQSLICAGTGNQFGSLNLTGLTNLRMLICAFNGLSSINLTGLTNLEMLSCGYNNFTTLDVSSLTNLQELYCSSISALTSLDVRSLTNLQQLGCSNNFGLQELYISQNQLTLIDLNNLPNLITLQCTDNPITTLDVSNLITLQNLNCSGNQLQTLNVNTLTNLQDLNCSGNQLTSLYIKNGVSEGNLDFSDNPGLLYVCADAPQIASVQTQTTSYGYTNCVVDALCSSGNSDVVTISDANFKAKLLESNPSNMIAKNLSGEFFAIDENNDAEIQQSEAEQVSFLDVKLSNIASLDGILSFTNLQFLNCRGNQLSELSSNGLTNLQELRCSDNQLTALDLNGISNLLELHCSGNQLTALNAEEFPNLIVLHCENNMLTTLDANGLPNLTELHVSGNPLTMLFIKNGSNEELEIEGNMGLEFICADEFQLSNVHTILSMNGIPNCNLNTYCSFAPGGTFYTIKGDTTNDANANGCDASDMIFSNAKFSITNGATANTVITDATGQYNFSVEEGTHTITPVLENPTYFNISPASVTVSFPAQISPFIQNFCYTPNGVHNDLEISMIPTTEAVPGFPAEYIILFKNKGNQTQSGTINLLFDETQATNNLSWDFANLIPLESRSIFLTAPVNSPMDTPPVNGGDVLNYLVTITSVPTDETPNDNTFALDQTVVNSFDPNDKICLEGATITMKEIGDYVHYMIRFENTGTFPARNIVVKDMIDTEKFDMETLVPIKGSHNFYTNIQENKAEFIFKNVNLPFDNANNDGFVLFKIKIKPELTIGDSFSNTASIYFDYNFPIETNSATTTILKEVNPTVGPDSDFMVYPNPVKNLLTVETNQNGRVSSIGIYNQLGQLVLAVPELANISKVDVSSLSSGNYFLKINSDKGTSNAKFIKQ